MLRISICHKWANRTSVKNERRRKTPGNHRNYPSSFCFLTVYLKINQEALFLFLLPLILLYMTHICIRASGSIVKVFSFLNAEAFLIVL